MGAVAAARVADGNVGMLFRLHHAVADGIAAIALMGALFETAPGTPPPPAPPWRPTLAPSAWQLFTDAWRRRADAAAAAGARLGHPAAIVHSAGARRASCARPSARAWPRGCRGTSRPGRAAACPSSGPTWPE